jgi:hypothetical protein
MLCGIAGVIWKDATGHYETDFNECFVVELGGGIHVHSGPDNNVEHRQK